MEAVDKACCYYRHFVVVVVVVVVEYKKRYCWVVGVGRSSRWLVVDIADKVVLELVDKVVDTVLQYHKQAEADMHQHMVVVVYMRHSQRMMEY